MRKAPYLVFILLIALSALSAGDYRIGYDSTSQNYVPFYGYVNYNWSKFFYSAAEMQAAGFTDTLDIVRIAFQVSNDQAGYVTDNQRVYMKAFYDSEYYSNTVNYPGTSGYYQVFNGSITWTGPGWVEVILDTPYSYNPNWGIEILWENRDGSRIGGPPRFCYTETSNYTAVQHTGSSGSFPTSNGTRRKDRRPNIWFVTPSSEAPTPGVALSPTDLATNVPINTTLSWYHSGGMPTGYRLWLGTDNPPSNIVSAQILSEVQYTIPQYLDYETTYYWRIVPYNDFGPALDCPVWSFTTLPDPSITVFPYEESFDGGCPPDNWEVWAGALADPISFTPSSSMWVTDDWLNIPSSDKAARINVWGSIGGYLISPLINVPSDDYVLEFDAAILKYGQTPEGTPPNYNAPDDRLAVLIGDGFTWTTANIVREYNNSGSEYVLDDIPVGGERIRVPLAGHAGHIKIAIFAGSTVSNDDNDFMVNNFRVGEQIPEIATPVASITLDTISGSPVLSWNEVPGATMYHIYMSNDPTADYLLFDTTNATTLPLSPVQSKAFFKITAE